MNKNLVIVIQSQRLNTMTEILIKSITYDSQILVIIPVSCPGLHDPQVPMHNNAPACVLNNVKCPYLDKVEYNHNDMTRTLFCTKENN